MFMHTLYTLIPGQHGTSIPPGKINSYLEVHVYQGTHVSPSKEFKTGGQYTIIFLLRKIIFVLHLKVHGVHHDTRPQPSIAPGNEFHSSVSAFFST